MQLPRPNGLITLLSDFGSRDPYVGIMKGVIKSRGPRVEIIDLCHEVPPQDVAAGALFLGAAAGRFPDGTVHVAVVDPGVGTERRVIAVCAAKNYWIGPDNGLLTRVLAAAGGVEETRRVDLEALRLRTDSNTFRGRDVFAPLGAMLAGHRYGFSALGGRVEDPVRLEALLGERVVAVDHFGNLILGVTAGQVRARSIGAVEIKSARVPVHTRYSDVPFGEPLALVNSYDLLEVAVNGGSAAERLGAGVGDPITMVEQS